MMSEPREKLDISDLKDTFLECPLCVEHFNQTDRRPRLLHSCLHAFCTQCLHQLLIKEGKGQITCPLCRRVQRVTGNAYSLPVDPVRGKLVDYVQIKHKQNVLCTECEAHDTVSRCQECQSYLCEECDFVHRRQKLSKDHTLIAIDDVPKQPIKIVSKGHFCPNHPKHHLEFYCTTDKQLCCLSCTVDDHKGHGFQKLEEAAASKRQELETRLQETHKLADHLKEIKERGQIQEKLIVETKLKSLSNINNVFDDLRTVLDQRKHQLVAAVLDESNSLLSVAQKASTAHDQTLAIIESTDTYFKQAKKKADVVEMLQMYPAILRTIDGLQEPQQLLTSDASVDDFSSLKEDGKDIEQQIIDLGFISTRKVRFSRGVHRFMCQHLKKEIKDIIVNLKRYSVDILFHESSPGFTIKGTRDGIHCAIAKLHELSNKIGHESHLFNRPECRRLLLTVKGKQLIRYAESRERCIIENEVDANLIGDHASKGPDHSTGGSVRPRSFPKDCRKGDDTERDGEKIRQKHPQGEVETEVTLHFFSDNQIHIQQAIDGLNLQFKEGMMEKVIEDDILKHLSERKKHEIEDLRLLHGVHLDYTHRIGRIRLQGLTSDVVQAMDDVYKIILNAQRHGHEMLSSYVQWSHFADYGSHYEYDKISNSIIEKAYKDGKPNVMLKTDGEATYIIDFDRMEEYPSANYDDRVTVVRKDVIKGATFQAPLNWSSELTPVKTGSSEYNKVKQRFLASLGRRGKIVKIELVQNIALWQQYVAKKQQLDKQNPGNNNERTLWHGTNADAIPSIYKRGFNRSICGKTALGMGVYFSVSTAYSAKNTYSVPNSQGHKHMFMARVLVGMFTRGQSGMRVPPVRDASNHILFDSVVDNPAGPGMYIIFNDTQAYPEYLITFICK